LGYKKIGDDEQLIFDNELGLILTQLQEFEYLPSFNKLDLLTELTFLSMQIVQLFIIIANHIISWIKKEQANKKW